MEDLKDQSDKSYKNTSTYRIKTGFKGNTLDILQQGEHIYLAEANDFTYHPDQGIDQYSTQALIKVTGETETCCRELGLPNAACNRRQWTREGPGACKILFKSAEEKLKASMSNQG